MLSMMRWRAPVAVMMHVCWHGCVHAAHVMAHHLSPDRARLSTSTTDPVPDSIARTSTPCATCVPQLGPPIEA